MGNTVKDTWETWHTATLVGIVVVILLVGLGVSNSTQKVDGAPWNFYLILLLLLAFIVIAGLGVCGRPAGFMIDARNKMSLSRLQLVLWTVLILSAYLTAVLARIKSQGLAALDVAMPQELWWLLGISTTSLVGSPLILSNKKQKVVNTTEKARTVKLLAAEVSDADKPAEGKQAVGAIGAVVVNASPKQARFADLFRGDETGNAKWLDLGKVQMFFFTFVIVMAYGVVIAKRFSDLLVANAEFPTLSQGMVALLGISHAGYLSLKAVPQSASEGDQVDHVDTPDPAP